MSINEPSKCRRCSSYASLVSAMERVSQNKDDQIRRLMIAAARKVEAVATLASEREANAILTAEVEALREENTRLRGMP